MTSYFTARQPPANSGDEFSADYYATAIDPDGKLRDLRTERERFIGDVAEEIEWIGSLQPGRVLDVGCGLGFLLHGIGSRWERHGVEPSAYAADFAARSGVGAIHFGNLRSAAYPTAHFDLVTCYNVFEHMSDPIAELLEMRRVLKPGGHLIACTPNFDSGCARRFGERYRMLHDRTHISLFDVDGMTRMLRDHGFVIDHVGFPYFGQRYFTRENLDRLFDTSQVSPPFYGNLMTFYAHRPVAAEVHDAFTAMAVLARETSEMCGTEIKAAGALLSKRLRTHKVLACGNGGSAADAQHFVAELVGRFGKERRALPAIALSSDPSIVTALGNDYGYRRVFERQVEAHGESGDVLVAISTSGKSDNVLRAIARAHELGMYVIALTGQAADRVAAHHVVKVPSTHTARIQEIHTAVLHAWCEQIEREMFYGPEPDPASPHR